MFEIGEYIVYGSSGICRVADIGPSPYDKADPRVYYLLIPLHNPMSSTIYTPVDNDRVPMRRLMTLEEIEALLCAIPGIDVLCVPIEKQRREIYRNALATLCPQSFVQVIKTVDRRRAELTAARKHVPVSDLEYGRLARHLLCSECAQVLGVSEEEAVRRISERLEKAE